MKKEKRQQTQKRMRIGRFVSSDFGIKMESITEDDGDYEEDQKDEEESKAIAYYNNNFVSFNC